MLILPLDSLVNVAILIIMLFPLLYILLHLRMNESSYLDDLSQSAEYSKYFQGLCISLSYFSLKYVFNNFLINWNSSLLCELGDQFSQTSFITIS